MKSNREEARKSAIELIAELKRNKVSKCLNLEQHVTMETLKEVACKKMTMRINDSRNSRLGKEGT